MKTEELIIKKRLDGVFLPVCLRNVGYSFFFRKTIHMSISLVPLDLKTMNSSIVAAVVCFVEDILKTKILNRN